MELISCLIVWLIWGLIEFSFKLCVLLLKGFWVLLLLPFGLIGRLLGVKKELF